MSSKMSEYKISSYSFWWLYLHDGAVWWCLVLCFDRSMSWPLAVGAWSWQRSLALF
jgi:hypothetical protein